ncbi:MAG: hypothetical protein U9O18_09090, partial [Chloroflexota bacterium]|nr:hypothetical protein [Chloroflexota bacterium]
MTSATPPQRAGEISGSSLFFEPLPEVLRRDVAAGLAEAIRRLVERVREVASSIPADCGTLAANTQWG